MNRTVKALTATLLTLGLAVVGLPLSGGGNPAPNFSIGCCRT